MGLIGTEPEEPVKDYIKKHYHLYTRGVYWLNATDELILEASVRLVNADIMVSYNIGMHEVHNLLSTIGV